MTPVVHPGGAGPYRAIGLRRNADRAAVGIADADRRIVVGRRGTWLEGFQDNALIAGACPHAAPWIDADELDAGRHAERHRRLVRERDLHEIAHDRGRQHAAGRAAAEMARLVIAEINADHEIGREADEPGVLLVAGGAGPA